MLLGTHQRLAKVNDFTVKARDSIFERVYQFNYLGVTLDPCRSWNDHIDHTASKILARIGMLREVRKVIPRKACITLYDAMILSLYDYCSAVWDSHKCISYFCGFNSYSRKYLTPESSQDRNKNKKNHFATDSIK